MTITTLHNTQTIVKSQESKANEVNPYYRTYPLVAHSEQLFQGLDLEDLREVAISSLREVGLEKEADKVRDCGQTFMAYRCQECGKSLATVFHCDQRICPRCYYRQLLRFFRKHRKRGEKLTRLSIVTISYGGYELERVKEGLVRAQTIHQVMLDALPLLAGGIYHIEIKYKAGEQLYFIYYHYLLDGDSNWAFFMGLALCGEAVLGKAKSFSSWRSAERYFIRECCKYPYDICLDPLRLQWFTTLLKRRKVIQGFRSLYYITGGRMKGKGDRKKVTCPWCGGECERLFLVSAARVVFDEGAKCWRYLSPGEG